MPLSLAFLAWAFGLGRRAAGVAAVLGVAVSSVYGGAGLNAIFGSGLLPNHLGDALLLVAFGGVVLVARRPSTRRIVFTAAAAAALVATHPIAAIILGFLSAALVVAAGIEWLTVHGGALGDRVRPWVDRVAPAPGSIVQPDRRRPPDRRPGDGDARMRPDARSGRRGARWPSRRCATSPRWPRPVRWRSAWPASCWCRSRPTATSGARTRRGPTSRSGRD